MTKANDILTFLDSIAPIADACEWDNCGLLCGDKNSHITKALVCLDITNDVIDEAVQKGAHLIISHHPVIFGGLKSIEHDSVVYRLVKSDIAAICMHTNLDIAQNIGVNVCLAKALKLLNPTLIKDEFLCTGELSHTLSAEEFALFVKENLGANGVRYTSSNDIRKVGVSSGAGSDSVEKMMSHNLDALVTGEIKHHHFLYAKEHHLCVVEAGHFNTEDVVISPLTEVLQKAFLDVTFEKARSLCDPVLFA